MSRAGSIWNKWNFHVHTKGTNKNDQFKSPNKEEFYKYFFKKAVAQNISAIGITDYFSIERYNEALEYRSDIENKKTEQGEPIFTKEEIYFIKRIFLFPNVELRMLPSTDKGKLVNIHCLFNPDIVSHLENDFFSQIENQDEEKMNRHGITNYGRRMDPSIKEEHSQYQKGIDTFAIDITNLKKALQNKRLRDNTILVVSNSNRDGASAVQQHYESFENEPGSLDGVRKTIYEMSHAIFSGRAKDIKYFLGRRREGTDGYNESMYAEDVAEVIQNRGSLKPCIIGCDVHTEEDLFKQFTWIKANLNFEGLRQICFEPEARVRIQAEKPEFKEDKLVIDKVRFLSATNVFTTEWIELNPNLNVIIGGKSSGKSILLYSIAKTLSANKEILKNEDNQDKYDFEKLEPNLDFEIVTKGGFTQKGNKPIDENSILPEIKYIPQNYLVKLAEPQLHKVGRPLNQLVRDLITENDSSKEAYLDFVARVKQNDKLRNLKIESLFEISQEILELENDLKTKSKKNILEENIKNNVQKIEELNRETGLTSEEIGQYKTIQDRIDENRLKLQKWRDDLNAIQSFNTFYLQQSEVIKQRKDTLISGLKLAEIKDYYTQLFIPLENLLKDAANIEKYTQTESLPDGKRQFVNGNVFADILQAIKEEKEELDSLIQPYLRTEHIKRTIEEISKSIANDKRAIIDIDLLAKKIADKKQLREEIKSVIFSIYKDSYKEYLNIISSLQERTNELAKDGLKIIGRAQFNFTKLRKDLYQISDGRTASYKQYEILEDSKESTDAFEFESLFTQIKKLFEDIFDRKYALTNRTSVMNAIKLVLEDYFFDYWEISYKKDKLGEMSTGKASFVILMLIIGLSKSKAPILIDQPEDNLDNRSITTDLVNYLRNKKNERQIIVVTHNANIVVNADAENVIVANQKDQNEEESNSPYKFDYINGAIENSFDRIVSEKNILKAMGIRQHIADIVEGGKEAFIKREMRYRFR